MAAPEALVLTEHTLANGLRVVVNEDHVAPVVAVDLWYDVGSRHEEPGRTGLAHLFEHLMFEGSANVAAGEHMKLVQGVGGTVNASTSTERTNYFEVVPAEHLPLALWLEADRLATLHDALDQERLDNQRGVVKNERRQRYDNVPYGTAAEILMAALFPEGHPYHHMTIGSMDDLDVASLADVRGFFRRHYAPERAVLTVAGAVATAEALALVEEHLGAVATHDGYLPAATAEPDGTIDRLAATTVIDVDAVVPDTAVYCGWRVPAEPHPDLDALQLAVYLLASGRGSRFQQVVVRQQQRARSASIAVDRRRAGASVAMLSATARRGVSGAELLAAVDEQLAALASDGPTEAEWDRARAQLERTWLDQLSTVLGRAELACRAATVRGSAAEANALLPRLLAVTVGDVQAAVAQWLDPERRVLLRYTGADG